MYRHFFKRFLDIFASLIILVLLSPILLVISIWLHFANKGAGVFFYQQRPGFHGELFSIIKFKSMTDEKDSEGNLLPNEQRITKIGALLRKTSFDELPQFINVLKGDMSMIGPRPLVIRYLDLYTPEQARRHDVRPGITGWAQVNGRNAISWTRKFELDVWYVDHVSLWLDMKIVYMTVVNILRRKDIDSNNGKVGAIGFNGHN